MKKTFLVLLAILTVCLTWTAMAENYEENNTYMCVVNCKEWVSLREKPSESAKRLEKVMLNEIVTHCEAVSSKYVRCEYKGQTGYIQAKYLAEAAVCLDWEQDGCHVIALRSVDEENEHLQVRCYVGNNDLVWLVGTDAPAGGQYTRTAAFMGGTALDPKVMLLNSEIGLSMLDLWDGTTRWTLGKDVIHLGSGNCFATDDNNGMMVIAGADGPDPVAISMEGKVLWQSSVNNDEVFWPYEIEIRMDDIEVRYESGAVHEGYLYYSVMMDMSGNVESIDLIPA